MTDTAQPSTDDLVRLQQVWENLAQEDPLWAISSWPSKRGGKWNVEEFFATGEDEVRNVFKMLDSRGIVVPVTAALDFGCGVGRVTQALARRFESVCGVDISPTMIEMANAFNQYPDRCRYLLNTADHLHQIADQSFSFIYSIVVLQHIPPEIARRYIAEFGRIVERGGVVMFQLTSGVAKETGLPADGWNASIRCLHGPSVYECGRRYSLRVAVTNSSSAVWRFEQRQPVMLGNHWLNPNLQVLRLDDGRTMLPNNITPGQSVELTVQVNTPPEPGVYVLELDVVQEGVSWFKDKGSSTQQIPVEVAGSVETNQPKPAESTRLASSAPGQPARPRGESSAFNGFSMHSIPRNEVTDILANAGLRLECALDSGHAGAGYQSYFYVARKP